MSSSQNENNILETIKTYDQTVDKYKENTQNLIQNEEMGFFLSLLPNGAKIIDIGCAYGRDAKIMADRGFKVIGIDLSKKMIERACIDVKNAEFKVMDVRKLAFSDESFDAAWASMVYLHIPKDEIGDSLAEVNRILKSDGILYISLKEGIGEEIKPDDRYDGMQKFWSFYQQDELIDLVINYGFELEKLFSIPKTNNYHTNSMIIAIFRKK